MSKTGFKELAALCKELEKTTKRKEKRSLIAGFLKRLEPDEVAPSVLMLVGTVFPEFDSRSLDIGWRTIQSVLEHSVQTTLFKKRLTLKKVHNTLSRVADASGSGSRKLKEQLLEGLFTSAESDETDILVRIIFGEMRIGASEGVMLEAIAEAADSPLEVVSRALMMTGDLGKVAEIALMEGEEGLIKIKASLFVPLKPMLANMAENVAEALDAHGGKTAFEFKYDGARIQVHRRNRETRIFSRRLSDVSDSVPEVVELVAHKINGGDFILEGEVVAIGANDRPLPFQDLMRRFTRVKNVDEMVKLVPLRLHLFDVLYREGVLLIDESYHRRWEILELIAPRELLANRIVTSNYNEAEQFLKEALDLGHEGLMAKRLDSPYTPGSRGKAWFKIKEAETLDLVVTAADWGSGRRKGWLSNYHLAVRDGDKCMVIGKTFKGLTDEQFKWMTEKLQSLKISESSYTVQVQPKLVVEVAFNEIQRSLNYESGYALRFARIKQIREDKGPKEADTLEKVKELYENQFKYKDRVNI
jgi:DNA ligase-1